MKYLIRSTDKEDLPSIITMLKTLPIQEKKYLALDKKMDTIRREVRAGRHTYVIVLAVGKIVAFVRESGRSNKFVLLEEIVVHPEYRNKGLANILLAWLLNKHPKMLAKTYAKNVAVIGLLTKNNFYIIKKSPKNNMVYWERK
jgi:N-acetylglutamate synthase-like GNAT family acetyltransferase